MWVTVRTLQQCSRLRIIFFHTHTHTKYNMFTYTIFFIRKSDGRILRRFDTQQLSKYFLKKTVEEQLRLVLNNNVDLERRDIVIKEYEGKVYNHE